MYFYLGEKLGRAAAPKRKGGGRRRALRYKSSLRSCLPCCGLSASIPHAGLRLYAFTGGIYHALTKPTYIPAMHTAAGKKAHACTLMPIAQIVTESPRHPRRSNGRGLYWIAGLPQLGLGSVAAAPH